MADWRRLVRKHLSCLALDSAEQESVHSELSGHLQEAYEALLKEGMPKHDATKRALALAGDWQDLQRKISVAKNGGNSMQKRVQQLWIPGLLTLTLSTVFLMTLQGLGFQPRIVFWSGPGSVLFYAPWLMSLPVFGAFGAYLSSRAGGSRETVILASVFPPLALTAAFLSMFPIGFIIERIIGRQVGFSGAATAVLRDGIGWILIPGAALLAGGLLAQFLLSRRLGSRSVAGN